LMGDPVTCNPSTTHPPESRYVLGVGRNEVASAPWSIAPPAGEHPATAPANIRKNMRTVRSFQQYSIILILPYFTCY
jgi:hypothetical protein